MAGDCHRIGEMRADEPIRIFGLTRSVEKILIESNLWQHIGEIPIVGFTPQRMLVDVGERTLDTIYAAKRSCRRRVADGADSRLVPTNSGVDRIPPASISSSFIAAISMSLSGTAGLSSRWLLYNPVTATILANNTPKTHRC